MTPVEGHIGQRFYSLVIVGQAPSEGRGQRWLARCDCGRDCIVSARNVRAGHTKSCGCRHHMPLGRSHGRSRATLLRSGLTADPTYESWRAMIWRCSNPKDSYYCQRGITVCARWRESFEAFLADMGERPAGTSLDRVDNDGRYEPGNCRWATRSQQGRNSRAAKLSDEQVAEIVELRLHGVSLPRLAARYGVSITTVHKIVGPLRRVA